MANGAPVGLAPGEKKVTAKKGAAAKAESKTKKEPKAKNSCLCGCGGETGGRFVPGHDARYYSWARQVAEGKKVGEIEGITAKGKKDLPDAKTAKAILAEHKKH